MRPGERHGRPGRPATEKPPLGDVPAIPDLLRQKMAIACKALHGDEQALGPLPVAKGELVMRALAGQERPTAPDSGAIEWPAILVLPITVIIVAMPSRPGGKIGLQQMVDHLHRVHDPWVIGRPQPE